MDDVIEESFEYRRDMLGPIDRCNVSCGSYGDKFHRWDYAGPYVEYEGHIKHISLYAEEIDAQRLRADTAEAELERAECMRESYKIDAGIYRDKLADAEQRIAEQASMIEEMATEMTLAITDSQIRAAMTSIGRTRFLQLLQTHNARADAALSTASPATINQQGEEA